jgi:hypothetical protein
MTGTDGNDQEMVSAVTERLRRANEQIAFTRGLGIDTTWFEELETRAVEALAQGKVDLADGLVDRISSDLPKETAKHINDRFNATHTLIEEAQMDGFEVDGQRAMLSEAGTSASMGDLERTVQGLDRIDIEVQTIRKRRTAKEAIDAGRRMGADVSDAKMYFAMGWKREQEGDMEAAIGYYAEALEAAIEAGKALTWKGE